MLRVFLIAPAVFALATTSPAAAAGSWRIGHDSFHVYLSDLDLQTARGRAQALERIELVAKKLCRDQPVRSARDSCRADVVARAVQGAAGATLRTALAERESRTWTQTAGK